MTSPPAGPGNHDGRGAIGAVAAGQATVEDIQRDALARIAMWEPGLGAIVETLDLPSTAPSGPLVGMMIGVKDQIAVRGAVGWEARYATAPQPSATHAPVVASVVAAGATVVATTASPAVGAPGGVTPQTANPRASERVSGGSSGGSAAAVAAGMVHGALGTDSGGSVRIPAACCGVVGLHTTRGLVPLTASGGMTTSIGAVGALAATVADVRLLVEAMARHDPDDPYSVAAPSLPAPIPPEGLRVGVVAELNDSPIDPEVRAMFDRVLGVLGDLGAVVERVSVPHVGASMAAGPGTIGIVESAATIEDRFGAAAARHPELASVIRRAAAIPSTRLVRAYHTVASLRAALGEVFERFDLLVSPTLPCRVPSSHEVDREADVEVDGMAEPRTAALTRFVNPWNLAAVPAGTLPVGRDTDGGPIGFQVVGPPFSDSTLLDVMSWIEEALGGPRLPEPLPT